MQFRDGWVSDRFVCLPLFTPPIFLVDLRQSRISILSPHWKPGTFSDYEGWDIETCLPLIKQKFSFLLPTWWGLSDWMDFLFLHVDDDDWSNIFLFLKRTISWSSYQVTTELSSAEWRHDRNMFVLPWIIVNNTYTCREWILRQVKIGKIDLKNLNEWKQRKVENSPEFLTRVANNDVFEEISIWHDSICLFEYF